MTEPAPTDQEPLADFLMNLIVALLAPMFLGISGGDVHLARIAAIQTVTAYRAANDADLIAVAQIIAFGLAALGSLSLSMADDISLSMALRLRGNANALNRSAEQNRRALNQSRQENPAHPRNSAIHQPAPTAATQPPAGIQPARQSQEPPADVDEREHQAMWANAMANVAAELTASLPTLSPEERSVASIRADALTCTANELRSGISAPRPRPGDLNHLMRPNPA